MLLCRPFIVRAPAQVRRFAAVQREPPAEATATDDNTDDDMSDDVNEDGAVQGQRQPLHLPSPPGGWSLSSLRAAAAGAGAGAHQALEGLAPAGGPTWWPWMGERPSRGAQGGQGHHNGAPWPSAVATAVTLSAAVVVFVKPQGTQGGARNGGGRRRKRATPPTAQTLFSEVSTEVRKGSAAVQATAPARTASGRGRVASGASPERWARVSGHAPGLDVAAALLAAALCLLAALELCMVRFPAKRPQSLQGTDAARRNAGPG